MKIPPFAALIKRIKIASFRQETLKRLQEEEQDEEMRFQKRKQIYQFNSKNQPVLPLVPTSKPADEEKDKTKIITFDLKIRTGTGAGAPSYKMSMRKFESGTPQEWMEVLTGLKEIWRQNSVNSPTDRAATVAAIIRGDSLTAFETALEDARVDPDPEDEEDPAPLVMTQEHIETALRAVTSVVFPFRALETQKIWMTRNMRKPFDMESKTMAAALSRINNWLPAFPDGTQASKFSESELIGLMEWSLPSSWRKIMDKNSFLPSMHTLKDLVDECERIERTETPTNNNNDHDSDNNKNNKKNKFAKFENNNKKNGRGRNEPPADRNRAHGRAVNFEFNCSRCGPNESHDTEACFKIKNLARKAARANGNENAKAKPFSKRTFRKEVHAMARRASKHDGLAVIASALKREESKHAKRSNKKKKVAVAKKADSDSDSDESMHNLEAPIPRKKSARVPKDLLSDPKGIFDGLQEVDSFNEDEMRLEGYILPIKQPGVTWYVRKHYMKYVDTDEDESSEANKATAEERAFLQSIDKEEEEQKMAAKSVNSN